MNKDVTHGLPEELAAALQDRSVIVPQDASVFRLIAQWTEAPSMTVSAELPSTVEVALDAVPADSVEPTTTPAAR